MKRLERVLSSMLNETVVKTSFIHNCKNVEKYCKKKEPDLTVVSSFWQHMRTFFLSLSYGEEINFLTEDMQYI